MSDSPKIVFYKDANGNISIKSKLDKIVVRTSSDRRIKDIIVKRKKKSCNCG